MVFLDSYDGTERQNCEPFYHHERNNSLDGHRRPHVFSPHTFDLGGDALRRWGGFTDPPPQLLKESNKNDVDMMFK